MERARESARLCAQHITASIPNRGIPRGGEAGALTLDGLVRQVELARHTKIRIAPLEALHETSACGLLLVHDGTHTIFHVATTSELHRVQCILHELSHMLLRHDESSLGDTELARFVPDVRLDLGDKLFGRTVFLDQAEVDAERLADRLASELRARPQPGRFEEYFG